MCGRYTLTVLEGFESFFEIDDHPLHPPRYNIAPTQEVPVVRLHEDIRIVELMRWGLIPGWMGDARLSSAPMINARSETVQQKPAFRQAYQRRRCLIPATGFYEWKREGPLKKPYYFRLKDQDLFAFAGLWELWRQDDLFVRSCAILTTGPNQLVRPIHDRMPVIMPRAAFKTWLGPGSGSSALESCLTPFPGEKMVCFEVSRKVNSPAYDSPECIEPIEPTDRKSRFPTLFDRE